MTTHGLPVRRKLSQSILPIHRFVSRLSEDTVRGLLPSLENLLCGKNGGSADECGRNDRRNKAATPQYFQDVLARPELSPAPGATWPMINAEATANQPPSLTGHRRLDQTILWDPGISPGQ
jgi:hypothetical protein